MTDPRANGHGTHPGGTPTNTATAVPAVNEPGKPGFVERRHDEDAKPVGRRSSVVNNRSHSTGLERRRGPGRRRTDFMKSAEEGQMSQEQFLFVMAIDAYKRVNQKPFPTWTEVLEVIRKLGYRKTCGTTLNISGCEDWTEPADAAAFVVPAKSDDAEG